MYHRKNHCAWNIKRNCTQVISVLNMFKVHPITMPHQPR